MDKCVWRFDSDSYGDWYTGCPNGSVMWESRSKNRLDDGMNFCPCCGGKITIGDPIPGESTPIEVQEAENEGE